MFHQGPDAPWQARCIARYHAHPGLELLCSHGGIALGWNSCPSDIVMVLLAISRLFLSAKTALPCVHSYASSALTSGSALQASSIS